MPMGSRHRLTGLFLNSPRGPVLQVDDGGTWALDVSRRAAKFMGKRVIVEGTRNGFDSLRVDRIELEPSRRFSD